MPASVAAAGDYGSRNIILQTGLCSGREVHRKRRPEQHTVTSHLDVKHFLGNLACEEGNL